MARLYDQHEGERSRFLDPAPSSRVPFGLLWAPSSGPGRAAPKKSEWAKKMGTIPLVGARLIEATVPLDSAAENYYWAAVSTHEVGNLVDAVLAVHGAARCLFNQNLHGDESAPTLKEMAIQDAPIVAANPELFDEFVSRAHELRIPNVISVKEGPIFRRTERLHEIATLYTDGGEHHAGTTLEWMAAGRLPCAVLDADYFGNAK